MNAQTPQVSIVLPTFDRLRFLRQSVESVFAQTFGDWELIVADDGSGAETHEYLESVARVPRVRILWLEHTGNPGTARNAALAHARAPYVAFLDSDDYWLPDKLGRQLAVLRAAAPRRWCYTAYGCVDGDDKPIANRWVPYEGAIFEQILTMKAYVAMPTVMAERALVEQVGGFDPGQVQHGDYELWLRMILASDVALLDESLARVRSHREHYTRGGTWALGWQRRMLEKIDGLPLDARRKRAVREARAANAAMLMRAHGAAGRRSEAARVFGASFGYSFLEPAWWLGAAIAALRTLTRPRVRPHD